MKDNNYDSEIWADIEGFEGHYQVSNLGRVKSLDRKINYLIKGKLQTRFHKGILMKLSTDRHGYEYVHLANDILNKKLKVHRLVANAFIKNDLNKPQVNHIDSNRSNNLLSNLEWATASENQIHALKNGEKISRRVLNNNTGKIFHSIGEASLEANMHSANLMRKIEKKSPVNGALYTYLDNFNKNPKNFAIKIICLETKEIFKSYREASRKTGLSTSSISKSCKLSRATKAGLTFKHLDT